MTVNKHAQIKQMTYPSGPWGPSGQVFGSAYPGVEAPFSYYTAGEGLPLPYEPQTKGASGFLANLPLKDIKAFVDRMGGIEGIMNSMNKAQQIIKSVQQMSPMLKLLAGSFLKSKSTDLASDAGDSYPKRRRRRKRRRSSSYNANGRSKKARVYAAAPNKGSG
ncbi:MAG TPA: hypothetical protein VGE40_05565 [Bacilli bacterium]